MDKTPARKVCALLLKSFGQPAAQQPAKPVVFRVQSPNRKKQAGPPTKS